MTDAAPVPVSPVAQIKHGLEVMRPQFKATLPAHIAPERFERIVLTAINMNPDLLDADRRSLFNATTRAAQDGLLPDGREGAFVVYKDKSGKKIVQWLPMVFGITKLIRQSGEIESIGARIVYQNEIEKGRFEFIVSDGAERLRHEPILFGERGAAVLVYAYARFKTGHVEYMPLHSADIAKRRAASRSAGFAGSPWNSWTDEMWLKTAIRALAKRLPLSSEIMDKLEHDDEPTEFEKQRDATVQSIDEARLMFAAPKEEPAEPMPGEPGGVAVLTIHD